MFGIDISLEYEYAWIGRLMITWGYDACSFFWYDASYEVELGWLTIKWGRRK